MPPWPGRLPAAIYTSGAPRAARAAFAPMSAAPATSSPPDYNDHPGLLLLLTLALIGVFAFLQVYSVQSILPELRQDLNATVVEIGGAVGATVLAVAMVSPLMGMLSDAAGRKWLVVASVFGEEWVTGRSGLVLRADADLATLEAGAFDALVIPGGRARVSA